jgi:hypothetical protein
MVRTAPLLAIEETVEAEDSLCHDHLVCLEAEGARGTLFKPAWCAMRRDRVVASHVVSLKTDEGVLDSSTTSFKGQFPGRKRESCHEP